MTATVVTAAPTLALAGRKHNPNRHGRAWRVNVVLNEGRLLKFHANSVAALPVQDRTNSRSVEAMLITSAACRNNRREARPIKLSRNSVNVEPGASP